MRTWLGALRAWPQGLAGAEGASICHEQLQPNLIWNEHLRKAASVKAVQFLAKHQALMDYRKSMCGRNRPQPGDNIVLYSTVQQVALPR